MRYLIMCIKRLQNLLVGGSIVFLMVMPILISYAPDSLPPDYRNTMFLVSLAAVTFVMSIRPLADLLPGARWLRSLVILRKGFGVLSASMIVSIILSKILLYGLGAYIGSIFTGDYWSVTGYAFLAHLGDLSAIVLLVTSNNFSKRILGVWWKRVQKLAYVYFYTGALYELIVFQTGLAAFGLILVTILVAAAFVKKRLADEPVPVAVPRPVNMRTVRR
jgi:hypothetical protein